MSKKTTMQVAGETALKLKSLKKKTGIPMGRMADLGLDYIEGAVNRGDLVVQNGRLVKAA